MLPEDRIRIQHMIEAAEAPLDFAEGKRPSDLEEDRMVLFAIIRAVEVVGEAAGRVSTETRERGNEIPWRAIISMRNRLVHGYFDIDVEIVWKTVKEELPVLVAQLKTLLSRS